MTSKTELPTLKFSFCTFFELVSPCEKNGNVVLDLITRDF